MTRICIELLCFEDVWLIVQSLGALALISLAYRNTKAIMHLLINYLRDRVQN